MLDDIEDLDDTTLKKSRKKKIKKGLKSRELARDLRRQRDELTVENDPKGKQSEYVHVDSLLPLPHIKLH